MMMPKTMTKRKQKEVEAHVAGKHGFDENQYDAQNREDTEDHYGHDDDDNDDDEDDDVIES